MCDVSGPRMGSVRALNANILIWVVQSNRSFELALSKFGPTMTILFALGLRRRLHNLHSNTASSAYHGYQAIPPVSTFVSEGLNKRATFLGCNDNSALTIVH